MSLKNLRDFVAGQGLGQEFAPEHQNPLMPGKTFHAPERTIIQNTGCYNCRHFECGEPAERYFDIRMRADEEALRKRGVSPEARRRALQNQRNIMQPPKAGLCLIGKAEADFTAATYMCESWSGHIKPEGGVSDTPQMHRERIDGEKPTD